MTAYGAVQKIGVGVVNRFTASTALMTEVGSRVYNDLAPADSALPLIVWKFVDVTQSRIFDADIRYEVAIEFAIYGRKQDALALHTIATLLETAFDLPIAAEDFDRVTLMRQNPSMPLYLDDSWSMIIKYNAVGYKTS